MPPPGVPESVGYIVLNRQWAFVQWLVEAKIAKNYILMAADVFVQPIPNFVAGGHPTAYPFFYIKPEEDEKIVRKYCHAENRPVTIIINPIGNSPVHIQKDLLTKIAPTWMNIL